MARGWTAVRGGVPVVDLTSLPETGPAVVTPRPPADRAAVPPVQRRVARRSDATGPLSLVPRRRRSPAVRLLRAVAFPALVLAVLALGGWETHRIVLAQQPTTAVLTSPTLTTSGARVVVLGASTTVTPSGRVVGVTVRVVGTDAGTFDPSVVTLRTDAGVELAVSSGTSKPVRLVAGRVVEGRLGFALPAGDEPSELVLRDPSAPEQQVSLRSGVLPSPRPGGLPAGWTTRS